MKKKVIDWIKKEIGWQNGSFLLLFLLILGYTLIKKLNRNNNSDYTNGISDGIKKGVKGNLNVCYHFYVDNELYFGSVPSNFCKECISNYCDSGNVVYIKYEHDNPINNELSKKNPIE